VTTRFLVDDLTPTGYAQVAEELVSGAVAVRYTHGIQRISQSRAGVTHFYGYDGGSVRQLTDTSGAVTDTYTFDAFGVLIGGTGSTLNAYRYRGEQWDASVGMYSLRARWYEPTKGRFWTADTYQGAQNAPATLHKYLYTEGNPVDYIDPTGYLVETAPLFTVAPSGGRIAFPRTRTVSTRGLRLATTAVLVLTVAPIAAHVFCILKYTASILDIAASDNPGGDTNKNPANCFIGKEPKTCNDVKGKDLNGKEVPYVPCERLTEYNCASKYEAEQQLKTETGSTSIRVKNDEVATDGPCSKSSGFVPGRHISYNGLMPRGKGKWAWKYAGEITSCQCCTMVGDQPTLFNRFQTLPE
jgi:RHS repeat-associated protein